MTDIDDQLEQMRNQLTYGHQHGQHTQTPAHGQQLAGDAPGGLTWAEYVKLPRPLPTDQSQLERLRSLPEEQKEEQDKSRGR